MSGRCAPIPVIHASGRFQELSDESQLCQQPVVSVLVIAYSHASYLAQCLASIVDQDFDLPFEVIVSDDASPDGTAAIAVDFQRRFPDRVRVLLGGHNVGARANSRRVLSAARAKILAWCEGDDYWTRRDKLSRQFAILQGDEAVGAVHCDWIDVELDNGVWVQGADSPRHRGLELSRLEGDLLATFYDPSILRTCTLMLRREVLDRAIDIGLYDGDYPFGDTITAFVASACWKIGYVAEVMAAYRHAPNSTMRSGISKRIEFLEAALRFDEAARHTGLADARYPPQYRWEVLLGLAVWNARAGDIEDSLRRLDELRRCAGGVQHLSYALRAVCLRSPTSDRLLRRLIAALARRVPVL